MRDPCVRITQGAEERMGDAFQLLSFGVQFDKKRFANDISLFEDKTKRVEVCSFSLLPSRLSSCPPSLLHTLSYT